MKYLLILVFAFLTIGIVSAECGDGLCEISENRLGCPSDCEQGSTTNHCNLEEDNVCDFDCFVYDPDCTNKEVMTESHLSPVKVIIVSGILFFVIFIGVFLLYKKAMKSLDYYNLDQINTFSSIKKDKEKTWSNTSEKQIAEEIINDAEKSDKQ